jgi:molybdate transport system substrate-binding protein
MPTTITGISSMATRQLLADLSDAFAHDAPWSVEIESIGGVDAARKVRDGAALDVIVLAANVMERLEGEGWIVPGSRADIARSGVAVAVRSGLPHPAIATEDDVKQAVLAAAKISYSSGPSGDHLKRLFERWKIADLVADRTVEAKPGIPVGRLVARGDADLGFQQLSEFLDVDGIDIVGPLPADIQTMTVFTAGIGTRSAHPDGARAFIAHLVSPQTQAAKQQLGMEAGPATPRSASRPRGSKRVPSVRRPTSTCSLSAAGRPV